MIHDTCPCCEVSRAPHADDCTFADDCPDACQTFDYVAELRAELDAAKAEVERHRMTGEERIAVRCLWAAATKGYNAEAAVVDRLLDRTEDGE